MTMMPSIVMDKYEKNSCCKDEKNMDYIDGDGVTWEEWKCSKCGLYYVVPIEIQRCWDEMELVERRGRER